MSKRQWLVLLMLFLTYLLLGASIFYHIESPLEIQKVQEIRANRIKINALLHEHYMPRPNKDHHEILEQLTEYCGKSVYNYTSNEVDLYKWDFYNSFYFAYTVVSTIGYGNLAPTNMLGRILMIFYGLIGIPMNGILLAQLGEFFGNVFVRAYEKYKTYKEGRSDSSKTLTSFETRRAGLAVQIFMYLIPGFIMFIFFPAFLFSYYEGWQYDEAVYYAFVTLSTVGFGDYVAGQDNTKGNGILWVAYKIFLICWISFGLGYLVMIMGFISRGMRSKRITRLEHKLAMNLKHTQSKIWNQFNKDLNYVRRVFNEVYLMKLKPVYRDDYDTKIPEYKLSRSHSFPNLRELVYGGLEIEEPIHPRRRANSEVAQIIQFETINRAVSETDLQRIDKKATFASHAMVQPAEFLAHLVNAMGYIPPSSDELEPPVEEDEDVDRLRLKGIDGFGDKDILASEKPWAGSGWRIGGEKVPKPRTRAASEIGFRKDYNGVGVRHNSEWTWSGPVASKKLQELIKARTDSVSNKNKETKSRIPSFSFASVPKNIRPRWFNPFSSKKNSGEMSRRESLPVDDIETNLRENYLSHTTNTRPLRTPDRRKSAAPHYFTHTGGNLPYTPDGNLLEETSLADFLRALTALHSRVGAVPEDFINRPQRKMGTASLTPPKLPSLLTLFAPPSGFNSQSESNQSSVTTGQIANRRFSLRPVDSSGYATPNYQRRDSLVNGSGPRRFSMMPDNNSGTSTPTYQRRGSLIPGYRPRRFSLRNGIGPGRTSPHTTPPYSPDMVALHAHDRQNPPPYSADPFIFECPKEPLVPAEVSPAQDEISLSVRATAVPRRFSLRPAQIGVPPAPPLPKTPVTGPRHLSRWKGGMLQRQINELNLQRRVRAFSLGDVHSIRSDRTVSQTSPLALPNATSNLSSLFASPLAVTTKKTDRTDFRDQDDTATTLPFGTLSSRTINDARQNSGSIDHLSLEQSLNNKIQMPSSSEHGNTAFKTGLSAPNESVIDIGGIDLALFAKDERGIDGLRTTEALSYNPVKLDIVTGKYTESSASLQPSSAYQAIHKNDRKMSAEPLETNANYFPELFSVVIDKPLSKPYQSYSENKQDSLSEVQMDSYAAVKDVGVEERSNGKSGQKLSPSNLDIPDRKTSVVSEKDTGLPGALSDEEKSGGRKISTMSQQSTEVRSISSSRKSSTSKSGFDKPRVSIDSYKPLMEIKIEKPATNPFEQYKATVAGNLDKPRERRSLDSQKISQELKGDVETSNHRHSTSVTPSSNVQPTSTQASTKYKDSKA